jgi:CCR4-NOT transcription complex subunit 6
MTYNILAETYATEDQHPYTPTHFRKWEYRREKILEEILTADADIICLQEVEDLQFREFFVPRLRARGYEGQHKLKTRAKNVAHSDAVDGCATFYRREKFQKEASFEVEYQTLAIEIIPTGPGLDRTIRRDNIALLLVLQMHSNGGSTKGRGPRATKRILVCNTHIHWAPAEADVKLMQVQLLLREVQKVCRQFEDPHMPLLITGDFNSEPSNAVYQLLKNGRVGKEHADWNSDVNYGVFSAEGCSHPFHLRDCFDGICEPTFSNFNGDFMAILDYIWYSSDSITCLGTAATPTKQEIALQKSPLPNSHYPSDHIFLLAEMELQSKRRT